MTRPTSLCRSCNRNIVVLARNFREHHLVGIFDQLPNDKLEKFSHDGKTNHESAFAQYYGATGEHESRRISARIKKQAFDTNASTPVVAVDRRYRSQSWLDVPDGGGASSCVDCEVPRSDWEDESLDASAFLVFLIKLRTVSDGNAPLLIQYSARSSFNVLLCPGFFGSYVPMISMNLPSRGLRLSATTTL